MVIEPSGPPLPPSSAPPPRPRWHPAARSFLFLVAFIVAQSLTAILVVLGFRLIGREPARALRQAVTVPLSVLALLGAWMLLVEVLPASDVRISGLSPAAETPNGALRLLLLLPGFLIQGGVEEW